MHSVSAGGPLTTTCATYLDQGLSLTSQYSTTLATASQCTELKRAARATGDEEHRVEFAEPRQRK